MGTAEGWFSLAAMVDISSRLVVGWATRLERDEALITKAAAMALSQRKPGAGLVHHSERGRRVFEARLSGRAQRS
ncbi:MAG: hypothetical protein ACJ8CB_11405 [Ktedonobacteraceae bacterium]